MTYECQMTQEVTSTLHCQSEYSLLPEIKHRAYQHAHFTVIIALHMHLLVPHLKHPAVMYLSIFWLLLA